MNTWSLFLAAFGLALALEGLPYFISPRAVRAYLRAIERVDDGALRALGLALLGAGLTLAWWATR